MKRVLITGAAGFVGSNLMLHLSRRSDLAVTSFDADDSEEDLERGLDAADVVVHLAGVNRPQDPEDFERGNAGFTGHICELLRRSGRAPRIVVSSSIQAVGDGPYGASKRHAEEALHAFADDTGADVVVFRLKNLFGKWSRPDYNSVVATFCHNVADGVPLTISDPARTLELVYVDDVVQRIVEEIDRPEASAGFRFAEEMPGYEVSLGELAAMVMSFPEIRSGGGLPDFSDRFTKCLYATYLTYLDAADLAYGLDAKWDDRGSLAEFIKSEQVGQLFVSRTRPGASRGGHYHDTKVEKFLVLEGRGVVRLRHMVTGEMTEIAVEGDAYRVVDIPPGSTHFLRNSGDTDMVTLFWASEPFDPGRSDTHVAEV